MDTGWIKLYRKTFNNPVVCKDPDHFIVWNYLLLHACRKKKEIDMNGCCFTLNPGQLLTGRNAISKKTKVSGSKVHRILKRFESEQQIEQQTSNKNRVVTILSWGVYQESEQQSEQQVNSRSNSKVNSKVNSRSNANNSIKSNGSLGLQKQSEQQIEQQSEQQSEHIQEVLKNIDSINTIFDNFRKLYPGTKRGFKTEFDNFKKKHKDWECVLPELESIILKQIETRKQKLAVGFAPEWPHLQTWINQRRWEQESPPIENNAVNSLASPEINNYDLPPDIESDYQVYFSQICKLFPSLAKSTCRIYSKDEYFDLRTDRTVTMRKKRITKTEYVKLRMQAHRELDEKAYLRSEYKTVYNYTRHLMRQKLDMYA